VYYDWYNSAVIPKCEEKKFLMSYEEICKEKQEFEKLEKMEKLEYEKSEYGNEVVKKVKRAPSRRKPAA
jgi:disulfide oxidoreductase YuzD